MPTSVAADMASATPSDASCAERARDVLLRGFVHRRIGGILNGVAVLVTLQGAHSARPPTPFSAQCPLTGDGVALCVHGRSRC
jgi:hypothetical protein